MKSLRGMRLGFALSISRSLSQLPWNELRGHGSLHRISRPRWRSRGSSDTEAQYRTGFVLCLRGSRGGLSQRCCEEGRWVMAACAGAGARHWMWGETPVK
ncbi:hypothetical protein FKM82_010993 [Ascaphus truei]